MSYVEDELDRLVETFHKQEIPAATLARFAELLADIPPGVLAQACRSIELTEEWFPSVAAIRQRCFDVALSLPTASQSLDWCVRQLNAVGVDVPYHPDRGESQNVVYPDPVTAEAIRCFGWGRLYHADPEWLPTEWAKTYSAAYEHVKGTFLQGYAQLPELGSNGATGAIGTGGG
jgi:hypothetical protein